jgi:hypothetical protein
MEHHQFLDDRRHAEHLPALRTNHQLSPMTVHLHTPPNQQTLIEYSSGVFAYPLDTPLRIVERTSQRFMLDKWRELLDQQSEKFG